MYAYSADFLISLFLTPRFGVLLHDATSFTVPHELKGLRRCRHAIVHKSRTSSSQKFLFRDSHLAIVAPVFVSLCKPLLITAHVEEADMHEDLYNSYPSIPIHSNTSESPPMSQRLPCHPSISTLHPSLYWARFRLFVDAL